MRFAIALAFNSADQWVPLARAADGAGFDSVVVSDHLVYPGDLKSAYPYTDTGEPRWDSQTAWPDPMIAIGAMAGATERLRFITAIYIVTLRHPVVAAKQVATADAFSDGRVLTRAPKKVRWMATPHSGHFASGSSDIDCSTSSPAWQTSQPSSCFTGMYS